jgi:5-methylthioadenosine/S-adenosylhomocysteine deaminase
MEVFGPAGEQCDAAMHELRSRVVAARTDETKLVRVGLSPHAPYSVSDGLYAAVAAYSADEELPVAVHIAESADEQRFVCEGEGDFAGFHRSRGLAVAPRAGSPVALLGRTGVLDRRPLCIHAVHASASDIDRLAASGASVAHCPRANAWFGHGRAPLAAFLEAGVSVGLGTDSAASNTELRMLAEAREAADETLTPSDRLVLATRGGAEALQLGSRIGTIVPGMQADFAAFAVRDIASCDSDPARYALEHCTGNASLLTVVAGDVRARRGVATGLDHGLSLRMAEHTRRVSAWASGLADASDRILDSTP